MQGFLKPRTSRVVTFMGVVCLVGWQMWFALHRFIAKDEGFYLYAARLILEGSLPYRDFFFPQNPLLPYVYAAWFASVGTSWVAARVFAALLATICASSIFLLLSREGNHRAARVALFIFATSASVQVWLSTAQTYSLSCALLLLSLVAHRVYQRPFVAGVLFGACLGSRLTFAPLAVCFLLRTPGDRSTRKANTIWFALGCLTVGFFIGPLVLVDRFNFWEHSFVYHLQRSGMTDEQLSAHRWTVLWTVLGFRHGAGAGGIQTGLLIISAGVWTILEWIRFRRINIFALAGGLLGIVHILPSPAYVQYFSVVSVMIIPAVALLWVSVCDRIATTVSMSNWVLAFALSLYAFCGLDDFVRFTETGDQVVGVGRTNRDNWRISGVREVSAKIDALNPEGRPVFASWPGYLLESRAAALPGTENHFGYLWAKRQNFTPQEEDRRKILSYARIVEAFREGKYDWAVIFAGLGRRHTLEQEFAQYGAIRMKRIGGVVVYGRE